MTTQVEQSPMLSTEKPPLTERGVIGWLYHNLFNSIGNTILTIVTAILLYLAISGLIRWISMPSGNPFGSIANSLPLAPIPQKNWTTVAGAAGPLSALWPQRRSLGQHPARHRHRFGCAPGSLAIIPLGVTTQLALAGALVLLFVGYVIGLVGFVPNRALDYFVDSQYSLYIYRSSWRHAATRHWHIEHRHSRSHQPVGRVDADLAADRRRHRL